MRINEVFTDLGRPSDIFTILDKLNQKYEVRKRFPVRIENKKVIQKTCFSFGYTPVFGEESFGEWIEFLGIKNVALNN